MIESGTQIEDAINAMDGGVNSGIAGILLPKNQLASARNVTLRGLYPMPRPPYDKITLNWGDDAALQAAVEGGLFQGACFYKPEGGLESILASISGRLYQFVIVAGVATVIDQTGSNAQSSSASQCWLWQAEKWAIWNDGISLPVFFDGNSTRRSQGPSVSLGTVNAQFNVPAVGSAVAVTLSATYTGPMNVSVLIGTLLFQVTASATTTDQYQVTIKTLYKINTTDAIGTDVISKPATIGYVTVNEPAFTVPKTGTVDRGFYVSDTTGCIGLVAFTSKVQIGTFTGNYLSRTANVVNLRFPANGVAPYTVTVTAGMLATKPTNTQPNVTVGVTGDNLTVPAVGASGTLKLAAAYTGPVNAIVYIAGDQFQITAVPVIPNSATINAILLTSTSIQTVAAATAVSTVPELPAGRMGAYGRGRVWMALTDGRSYVAGDIAGGSAGTLAYGRRDAVLKVTENALLAGGGTFSVPGTGDIRSMRFTEELDKSLGQGPLQIGTPNIVFSCNAPTDRSTWQSVTNPIQTESLIGQSQGPTGQDSTVISKGEMFFRSRLGIGSLLLARRDFNTWGKGSISNEIRTFLQSDDPALLPFASGVDFDNRLLMTIAPTAGGQGAYFTKLAVINFDPISSLRGKAPAIYDGIWDGLNILKLVSGQFAETDRAFAFHFSLDDAAIQLYEIKPFGADHFDNSATKIVQELEFPVLPFAARGRSENDLIRLVDGEIYCDLIDGETLFETWFRPDYDPAYHRWYAWTVPASPTYQPIMGLGEPPADSNPLTERPNREGYRFFVKVKITGFARVTGARFRAVTLPSQRYAPQMEETIIND